MDVRDIADIHIGAMTNDSAAGQRFLGTAGLMSLPGMAATLKQGLGVEARRRQLRVLLHANDLVVYDGCSVVAHHEWLSGRGESRLVLDHCLEALLRKTGAFSGANALEQAKAAGKFTPVHEAWWTAASAAHGEAAGTRALIEVLLLGRHMEHEHVVAGLAAAHRAGALTADAVALEARKVAEGESFTEPAKPTRGRSVQSQEETDGTVTFLSDWKLSHLAPGTRPLPSVAHYDQLLQRHGRTAGEKEGS